MSSKWAVERHSLFGGWEYDSMDEEGQPELFDTPEKAQADIDDLMEAVKEAVAKGDMASEYNRSDYRVVEVVIDE